MRGQQTQGSNISSIFQNTLILGGKQNNLVKYKITIRKVSLKQNRVLDIISDTECLSDNHFDDVRVVELENAYYLIGLNHMFAKIFVYKIGEEVEHKRSLWK